MKLRHHQHQNLKNEDEGEREKKMEGKRHHKIGKTTTITKCIISSPTRKKIELFHLLFILTAVATLFTSAHQHQEKQPQFETDDWTRSTTATNGRSSSGSQGAEDDSSKQQLQQSSRGELLPADEPHSAVNEQAESNHSSSSSSIGDDFGQLTTLHLEDNYETLKIGSPQQDESSVRQLGRSLNETTSKPAFTSLQHHHHRRNSSWSNKNVTAAPAVALANVGEPNNRTASESRQLPTDSSGLLFVGDSINNKTTYPELFASPSSFGASPATAHDDEDDDNRKHGSSELIGVHNYLQFGGGDYSQEGEESPITILPPTRNLNASLEAQAKLKDAMIQLHYNKTLAFEKTNTSQLLQDQSSLLPNYSQQAANPESSQSNNNEQFVSVSPTQEPSSRIEWMSKPNRAGGDLLEAAGEIHQHRRQQLSSVNEQPVSFSHVGDWGRRKSANSTNTSELTNSSSGSNSSNYSEASDLITWTPAAGPAAYKAGSSVTADFISTNQPLTNNSNNNNMSESTSTSDYSEPSESRQSFETRSRPSVDSVDSQHDSRTTANRRKTHLGGSKRLNQAVRIKTKDNRQQETGDEYEPTLQDNKQRTRKLTGSSSRQQFSRPLVELPKAPPPDPELEDDSEQEESSGRSDQNESSTENYEDDPPKAVPAKRRPNVNRVRVVEEKISPAKRQRQNYAVKVLQAEKENVHLEPEQEENEAGEETRDDELEQESDGRRKTKQKVAAKKPTKIIRQKKRQPVNRVVKNYHQDHQTNIKWSPQTSFTGDEESPDRRQNSSEQSDSNPEASLVVGSRTVDHQNQEPDQDSDEEDGEQNGIEVTSPAPRYLPPTKEKQFAVSGAAVDSKAKPPVIRTFRLAEQGGVSSSPAPAVREFSSPSDNTIIEVPPRVASGSESFQRDIRPPGLEPIHQRQTIGGFSPQSSLPATLIARPMVNFQRQHPATNFAQKQQTSSIAEPAAIRAGQHQHFFHAKPPQSSSIITSGEPFNEAQASSEHQQERFYNYNPVPTMMMMNSVAKFQVQPQQHVANNYGQLADHNQNHNRNQNLNNSSWSIVTFPYPQQQQQPPPSYRPSQQYPSSAEFSLPGPSHDTSSSRRAPTITFNSNNQLAEQPSSFFYHMPAPQLNSGFSTTSTGGILIQHQQPEATQFVQQHQQLVPEARPQQQPMLIQRGIRQAPIGSSIGQHHDNELPPLTIRLNTATQSTSPIPQEQQQQQQSRLAEGNQRPKVPLSNGHLPPRIPQRQDNELPTMRRPVSVSFGGHQSSSLLLPHPSSRTNGHAYAGQPKLPQMGVAPSAWLHQNQPAESAYSGGSYDEEFIAPHFAGAGSELSALFESPGNIFAMPPHSSLFEGSHQMQQLAAAAATPASVFMAPQQSQFVKKGTSGVTPISARLPLANPAFVRDAFGWPMGYGSKAAKTLLKVNHVAPPPAYLIPDKVSEAQTSALFQPTMIEPGSSKGKPPRISPLQEDSSIIQQPKDTSTNNNNWLMGEHSMLMPQIVWPQSTIPTNNRPVSGSNSIEVVLSTRSPSITRRAKLWQRLRSMDPFGRHRSSALSQPIAHDNNKLMNSSHRMPAPRFKRGIIERVSKLVTLKRHKPSTSYFSSQNGHKQQYQQTTTFNKLALIELGDPQTAGGSSEQTFIPLVDSSTLLESDVLNRALAYNSQQQQQQKQPSRDQDPMLVSQSGLVPSLSAHQSSMGLESAREQQQQQQSSPMSYEHLYMPASLEPPANEPPGKSTESRSNQNRQLVKKPTSERLRHSISQSLSKPLSRIKSLGTRWFPSTVNSTSSHQRQQKTLLASGSQVQPTMSAAQQLNSFVSPSVMISHHVGSLENFNRFAIPIHQYWLQQQQQQAGRHHQGAPLFPLTTLSSQSMSPYSFGVEKNRPVDNRNNHSSLMNPMAAATNNRPFSWLEPPMMFSSLQQNVNNNNNNLRRSEFEQYLPAPNSRHQQHHANRQFASVQRPNAAASGYLPRPLTGQLAAHDQISISSRPPFPPARHNLRPSPRMQQDANVDSRPPISNITHHHQQQQQRQFNHLPTKLVLREPTRQHNQPPLQQQQQEMFADLTPSQLDSLTQSTEFVGQEPSMMQSLITSASNTIQDDSQQLAAQKPPLALAESVPQTAGDFTLAEQQQHFQQQQQLDTNQYFQQPASFANVQQGLLAPGRPRLPKLLPSINSMANKFRQHLYQTFRLTNNINNNYPLLSSVIPRRPGSFDSATYISPSYVTYPNNQFHLHQQHQPPPPPPPHPHQQQLISATNYLPQTFSTAGNSFAAENFGTRQLQRPIQHQHQQQAMLESNSISNGEHEIVYETPAQPTSEFSSHANNNNNNGTQMIHVQSDTEPGQVVEMYEQVIEAPPPDSIQQQIQHQQANGTDLQYEQAHREESTASDGNHLNQDVNLVASDGTYIQDEVESSKGTQSQEPQSGDRLNIEDLRNKTNITVHHHHVIEEDQQQPQPQQVQEADSSQQQQQDEQEGQPINGSVIETTQQQQQYEPERIQVRQPPRLVQVGGRKVLPSGRQKTNRFVNRHNSTSSASSERADYQIIRASSTSLSRQRAPASSRDDDHEPSVYVKLINSTIEPISAQSSTPVDSTNDDNSIQQHQQAVYDHQQAPQFVESNESDQQQQAGLGEVYEPNDDQRHPSSSTMASPMAPRPSYDRTNRTLEYGSTHGAAAADTNTNTNTTTTTTTMTTNDDYSNDVYHSSSQDISRARNYSQPMVNSSSIESSTSLQVNESMGPVHQDHYVLVDQPVILSRPAPETSTNQTPIDTYEPPMVFVSTKPERIVKELPFKGNSYALNRKRPLKRPKSGQSKLRLPPSELDSEKATELSASHSSAQNETTRYYKSTTTSGPTIATTLKPRVRNSKATVAATSDMTTTERPRLSQASFTRAPKSRIRWQGANGRLSLSSSSSNKPVSNNINQTELSSSETSRREQAWIVSSMTHQAYSDQPANGTGKTSGVYTSRTNPIELVENHGNTKLDVDFNGTSNSSATTMLPPIVVGQHNSSYFSEPINGNNNASLFLPINGSLFEQSTKPLTQTTNDTSHRIYANYGSIAKTNSSKRHTGEPRGRFHTFKSSLSRAKSSNARSSDWPTSATTTTVAPPTSTSASDSNSNSNSDSDANWSRSHESRTAPTSFRLSAVSTVTSQQPALQQLQPAPMVDALASTTPLSFLDTPPSRISNEYSARSDAVGSGKASDKATEDLTLNFISNSTLITATTATTTTVRPALSEDDSMAWLTASLDDTREDRLASSGTRHQSADLAKQTIHLPDDASLQIKIAPGSSGQQHPSEMISFLQLRHTND